MKTIDDEFSKFQNDIKEKKIHFDMTIRHRKSIKGTCYYCLKVYDVEKRPKHSVRVSITMIYKTQ